MGERGVADGGAKIGKQTEVFADRQKGTALGLYNTVQALGLFAGGALGGWASSRFGGVAVFVPCAGVMAVWLVVAMGARRWPQPGGRAAAAH